MKIFVIILFILYIVLFYILFKFFKKKLTDNKTKELENTEEYVNINEISDKNKLLHLDTKVNASIESDSNSNTYDNQFKSISTITEALKNNSKLVDDSVSNTLKRMQSNEINLNTIRSKIDNKPKNGSINMCNTNAQGKRSCSHFPFTDGNTYIRPGETNKNIYIDNADTLNFGANKFCFKDKKGENCVLSSDVGYIKNAKNNIKYEVNRVVPPAIDKKIISLNIDNKINNTINTKCSTTINNTVKSLAPSLITNEIKKDNYKIVKDTIKSLVQNELTYKFPKIRSGYTKIGNSNSGSISFNNAQIKYGTNLSGFINVTASIDDGGKQPVALQINYISDNGFRYVLPNNSGSSNRAIRWTATSM